MGPPTGMNLRNVVWHGFTTEAEFPRCYFSLLLVLVDWIGAKIAEGGLDVRERPLADFSSFFEDHSSRQMGLVLFFHIWRKKRRKKSHQLTFVW